MTEHMLMPMTSALESLSAYGEAWSEIARLSPMVVALRTDAAIDSLLHPPVVPSEEPIRMVAEKIDAVAEGAVAATLATGLAVGRTLIGRGRPFEDALSIATAAVAPARSRLRANVARLGHAGE